MTFEALAKKFENRGLISRDDGKLVFTNVNVDVDADWVTIRANKPAFEINGQPFGRVVVTATDLVFIETLIVQLNLKVCIDLSHVDVKLSAINHKPTFNGKRRNVSIHGKGTEADRTKMIKRFSKTGWFRKEPNLFVVWEFTEK